MLVGVLDQDLLEELAAGAQDHFVNFHLFSIVTGQSDIREVFVALEALKRFACGTLEFIPR